MNSQPPTKARIPDIVVEGEPISGPPATIRHDLAYIEGLAQWAAASQFWNVTRAQAVSLMCLAESRGIAPIEALVRYHVIDGKPSMSAQAMQAEFQKHGGRIQIEVRTNEECRLEVWHLDKHPKHVTFSVTLKELVDSHVASIWDSKQAKWKVKPTYQKHPRQMLHARCISEAIRAIDPGCNLGIYCEEEVRDWDYSAETRPRPWVRPAPEPETHVPAPAPPAARRDAEELLPGAGTAPDRAPVRAQMGGPRDQPGDPSTVEVRAYIRHAIREATQQLHDRLREEQGDDTPEIVEEVCNGHQVVNHLVTQWIDEELIDPMEVNRPDGMRDKEKAIRAVAWAFGRIRERVEADVHRYVDAKQDEALRQHGISPGNNAADGPGSAAEGGTT